MTDSRETPDTIPRIQLVNRIAVQISSRRYELIKAEAQVSRLKAEIAGLDAANDEIRAVVDNVQKKPL